MYKVMLLQKLQQILQMQAAQSGKVTLSASLINQATLKPRDQFDNLLRNYLMLQKELIVTTTTIAVPSVDTLTFTGTMPLPQQNIPSFTYKSTVPKDIAVTVTFTIDVQSIVDLELDIQLEDAWSFYDSFPFLSSYAFGKLTLSEKRFVFTTRPQATYKFNGNTLTLQQGLNFISCLTLNGPLNILHSLLQSSLTSDKIIFSGIVDPTHIDNKNIINPDIKLIGSLNKIVIKIPPFNLDNPRISLETMRDANKDTFTWLCFVVTLHISDTISADFKATIFHGNNYSLGLSLVPDEKHFITVQDLIQLIGGQDFTQSIPGELKDIFEEVSFKGFSASLGLPKPTILYLIFAVGTANPWQMGAFTLKDLTLRYSLMSPYTPTSSSGIFFDAKLEFFPQVFQGVFDVELIAEKNSISSLSASYTGEVKFNILISAISDQAVTIPQELVDITFSDFGINFTKASDSATTYDYTLYGSSEISFPLPIASSSLDANFQVLIQSANNQKTYNLSGGFKLGHSYFSFLIDLGSSDKKITATWKALNNDYLEIGSLITAFGFAAPDIPKELDLALKSASLSYDFTNKTLVLTAESANYGKAVFVALQNNSQWQFYFGLAIDTQIDLARLPLVGPELANLLSIKQFQLSISSKNIDQAAASNINLNISNGYAKMPALGMANGIILYINFDLNGNIIPLDVVISDQSASYVQPTEIVSLSVLTHQPNSPDAGTSATWYAVQKTIGPIILHRIGISYESGSLWLLLDSGLSTKVFNIDLLGLGIGLNIEDPKQSPGCTLDGLGISLQTNSVNVAGTFVRVVGTSSDSTEQIEQYAGQLAVKAGSFALSAYGSYEKRNGQSSLFAFVVIDYPLGGCPAFFITGGALGLGYNRGLLLPNIDGVASYPFIEAATKPDNYKGKPLAKVVDMMGDHVPVILGQYWLAAGIKFTSFSLINSFAVTTVSFGKNLEIALLGISTLKTPKDGMTLAYAQLALEARFFPTEGFLGIDAKLTSESYIISPSCKLSGGFAFYIWFKENNNTAQNHKGDFVLTLGGYHPNFNKPDHYPTVPRLGINWDVGNGLSIKGGMYFALTPVCIMAGTQTQAVWQSGGIRAWFDMHTDILVFWRPFHYDLTAGIDIGCTLHVSFWFCSFDITVSIGADLHIWGPEFAGQATVHLWIASFTINFGNSSTQAMSPISWSEFKTSFLGDDNKVCSISVSSGLIKTLQGKDDQDFWIVDPENASFITNSAIPIKQLDIGNLEFNISANELMRDKEVNFGVGMVCVESINSVYKIEISKDGKTYNEELCIEAITSSVSKSLWQNIPLNTDCLRKHGINNNNTLIENVVIGYKILPKVYVSDKTLPAALDNLLFSIVEGGSFAYNDAKFPPAYPTKDVLSEISDKIAANSVRDSLMKVFIGQRLAVSSEMNFLNLAGKDANENYYIDGYFSDFPVLSYLVSGELQVA
jgi:hypothetical protein